MKNESEHQLAPKGDSSILHNDQEQATLMKDGGQLETGSKIES